MEPSSPGADDPARAALTRDQHEQLRLVVIEACIDMFTAFGFAVRVIDVDVPLRMHAHDVSAVIGFDGAVRGTLMVSARSHLFRSTNPVAAGVVPLSDDDVLDWTREMANQLLGRVKRRFCERGQDFQAGPSSTIAGREIARRFPARAGVVDLALTVGGDVASICFEVTPPPGGQLFPDPVNPIPVSGEGEVFLF
jgi:CheY-specific phosphatase CheX